MAYYYTPWGQPDSKVRLCSGIMMFSTPTHGGIRVSPGKGALMPANERGRLFPWYEEDCEMWFVLLRFMDEINACGHNGWKEPLQRVHLQRQCDFMREEFGTFAN